MRWFRAAAPAMRIYTVVAAVAIVVCLIVVVILMVQSRPADPAVITVIAVIAAFGVARIPLAIIDQRHRLDAIVRRAELEDQDAEDRK